MEPADMMRTTQRGGRHGGLLYTLLLIAAVAVIAFSIIGIATTTGLVSNASLREGATTRSGTEEKSKPTRIETPRSEPRQSGARTAKQKLAAVNA